MIGYDYTDPIMQPPDDGDIFITTEERVIEALENAGYGTVADTLSGSKSWINAIEALIAEEQSQRNMI